MEPSRLQLSSERLRPRQRITSVRAQETDTTGDHRTRFSLLLEENSSESTSPASRKRGLRQMLARANGPERNFSGFFRVYY
jgi:hypothetical protein